MAACEHDAIPGARFVDPEGPRADRQPRAAGADRRRRLHQRPAPRAVLRRVDRLRRAPRLRRRRRHPPRRLAAVRADRSLLRQAVRGRHQHQLLGAARHLEVDGVREPRRRRSSNTAATSARASPIWRTGSATASASSRSTATSSRTCRRRRSTSTCVLHTLDRAKAERPGQLSAPLNKMAEHFKRRGILAADLGLLRRARRDPRGDQAAAVPRQRPDRLPRARSGGDRLRLRRRVELRGPRERRADAGRARVVREQYRKLIAGAHRRADDEVLRAADRLHAAQHRRAARPRAVQLPVEPRAADAGAVTRLTILIPSMSFLTPLFLVGLGAIAVPILVHLIQRERKRVIEFPSLMFVQTHSVSVGAAPADPPLVPAADARRGDRADRRGVRAAVLPAGRRGGRRRRRRARGRHPARSVGEHGLRRSLAARARRGARAWSRHSAPTIARRSCCSARNAEENMRATSDRGAARGAHRRREGRRPARTRYGPALKLAESILSRSTLQRREAVLISDFQKTGWSGAEDVHFPEGMTLTPVSVASPTTSNLSVPSVTLRARRRSRARSASRSRPASRNKGDQPADGRAGDARDRRPRDRDRARHRRAARVGVGHVRAVHAGRAERARHRARRHRSAARRQHLPLRAGAERAGVGADRRRRRSRRREPVTCRRRSAIGTTPPFQVETCPRRARDAGRCSTSAPSSS